MQFAVNTAILFLLLTSATNANASDFDDRRAFLEKHRALATTIGIMKFFRNEGLERALRQHAAGVILKDAVKSNRQDVAGLSADILQALDFHAVGVATGIRVSGVPQAAQDNLCTLGRQLADKVLSEQGGP